MTGRDTWTGVEVYCIFASLCLVAEAGAAEPTAGDFYYDSLDDDANN